MKILSYGNNCVRTKQASEIMTQTGFTSCDIVDLALIYHGMKHEWPVQYCFERVSCSNIVEVIRASVKLTLLVF